MGACLCPAVALRHGLVHLSAIDCPLPVLQGRLNHMAGFFCCKQVKQGEDGGASVVGAAGPVVHALPTRSSFALLRTPARSAVIFHPGALQDKATSRTWMFRHAYGRVDPGHCFFSLAAILYAVLVLFPAPQNR